MAWRRLAAVLLLASAGALAVAQVPATPSYLPERETSCWDCHAGAAFGSSPPVSTFLSIHPPQSAGAAVGVPFDYPVRIQNAWTANLTFLEPELDLSKAPSLAFAANVPPFDLDLADTLDVDPVRAAEAQAKSNQVEVPVGLTHLLLRLQPDDRDPVTGPDLALRVEAGGFSQTIDAARRGGVEELNLTSRSQFSTFGYGTWIVSAVWTPVRADPNSLADTALPKTEVPFRLAVHGGATDTPERVAGLPSREVLARGEGATAMFRLVALAPPGAGETVDLRVKAHVHYPHPPRANAKDDADLVKAFDAPIEVVPDAVGVRLGAVAPATVVPAVHNGATMATIAEAIGYASAFLILASTTAGGMFGKASRRWANGLFGSAKRRVGFHNFLSYGLILAASAHTGLFLVEAAYAWTVGLVWGGLAGLCMLALGVTGALQVPMIRKWDFPTWRWTHHGLAVATIVFTLVHIGLDGAHFSAVQESLGWKDPVVEALS